MDNDEFVRHVNYSPINEMKRLYHGSKSGIQGRIVPNFRLARRAIDFGQGFYLGESSS